MEWIIIGAITIIIVIGVVISNTFIPTLIVDLILVPIGFIVMCFTKGPKKAWKTIKDYLKDWTRYI